MQADAVDKKRKLRTLFFSTLELSAFTFGGGFVIIPLLRKNSWISCIGLRIRRCWILWRLPSPPREQSP